MHSIWKMELSELIHENFLELCLNIVSSQSISSNITTIVSIMLNQKVNFNPLLKENYAFIK